MELRWRRDSDVFYLLYFLPDSEQGELDIDSLYLFVCVLQALQLLI